jgi:acyl-CoA thioesterase I
MLFVATVVVAALVAAAVAIATGRAGASNGCVAGHAAADDRSELVTGAGPETLVIGDSYSVGLGVKPAESWPTRLPGTVRVDGFSGSGFSAEASGCAGVDFATRAETAVRDTTRLVVVQGGLNDFDQPAAEIEAGFYRLMRLIGDRPVLVVGPPDAPARSAEVPDIDELLARLTKEYGAAYLRMRDHDLTYLPDALHLTVEGHRRFGDIVAGALAE